MKKVFWFVLLGSLPNLCYSSASHENVKTSNEVTLQQHREILTGCVLYLQTRNDFKTIVIEIDFESKTLHFQEILDCMASTNPRFLNHSFKYLNEELLKKLATAIQNLSGSWEDKVPPALWKDLCKNAGVPEEEPCIGDAIRFLNA